MTAFKPTFALTRFMAIGLALWPHISWGDVFVMRGGNRVEGTWVNREEEAPAGYVVKTREGSEIVLPREKVTRVVESTPQERRYDELLPRMPETADGHWRMADWCRKSGLSRRRMRHLEAVIELDPDHADARRALGYTQRDGQWTRPEEVRRARGYVQYKGDWYLPQELELVRAREAQEAAAKEWKQKLRRWHGSLSGKRASEGREKFEMLSDPAAATEVARLLVNERDPEIHKLLMQTLARLGGPVAERALAEVVLSTENPTLRELARDYIVELGGRWAYPEFLKELGSKNVSRMRQAAFALGLLRNREAVLPLINVLVTTHRWTVSQGGPGSINATFGNGPAGGGTGFSTGARVSSQQRDLQHADVLAALKNLTGENFGYDQPAWRDWHAESNTPPNLDLRRGR